MDNSEISNESLPYNPDYIIVTRTGNSYTASYTSNSVMSDTYSSTSVSSGIMAPFPYINVGRPRNADDQIAKVRLIVPHTQGHTIASSYVYPYYYELSFQKKIDL